jgi:hypothetical protein
MIVSRGTALPKSRATQCVGVYLGALSPGVINTEIWSYMSVAGQWLETSLRRTSHIWKHEEREAKVQYWAATPYTTTL